MRLPNYPRRQQISGQRAGRSCSSADLHHLLAEILAFEQADEGARRVLETFGHGLAVFDLALAHILSEPLQRLGPAGHWGGDDEAHQLESLSAGGRVVLLSLSDGRSEPQHPA